MKYEHPRLAYQIGTESPAAHGRCSSDAQKPN